MEQILLGNKAITPPQNLDEYILKLPSFSESRKQNINENENELLLLH